MDLKGFDRAVHDGVVLDNCNSFGQLLKWRSLLQARHTLTKGGQSATQMYAYSQYLFMTPIVATVDFNAKDAYLMDETSNRRSKWLLANAVYLRLSAYRTTKPPPRGHVRARNGSRRPGAFVIQEAKASPGAVSS